MYIDWTAVTALPLWRTGTINFWRMWAYAELCKELRDSLERAYPACFVSVKKLVGPVPWTVLQLVSDDQAQKDYAPITARVLGDFNIDFTWVTLNTTVGEYVYPQVPDELREQAIIIGEVIEIEKKRWIVMAPPDRDEDILVAPPEQIDVKS